MLYVNNDMDELFRQAAENYPLKTDNAEWNKVKHALPVNNRKGADREPNNSKNKYWLLLLLLLFPMAWIANNYFSNKKPVATGNQVIKNPETGILNKNFTASSKVNDHTAATSSNQYNTSLLNILHPTNPATPVINSSLSPNTSNSMIKSTQHLSRKGNVGATILNTNISTNNITQEIGSNIMSDHNKVEHSASQIPVATNIASGKENTPTSININNKQQEKKNILSPQIKSSDSIKNKMPKQAYLYAGIIAGLDVSTVKLQNIIHSGLQAGLLIGYNFNKNWSIESGIYFDKKYYYTDGRYFNSKVLYLQGPAKLIDVTGNCNMLEIPVNVKYTFLIVGKTKWFSILGISSYFMKKQSYEYGIHYNSYVYQKYATYSTASNALFSVINIGGGLTTDLGKKMSFRLEPYIKIPLQGIGVGDLPISSAGLNIGVTRKFTH